ncbi:MAG TPA: squalene/phytoene synthase family protein [Myxococcota bacterium]|nr:squalene/phytoene synthase family protein [Myxococcota bacterium]HRY97139.1 squalene/phytoene synthase family protein [Myxococcota bacterium]HSA23601.1 squalene/phytoene synthase family protein [Myxococcota bacterium]
MAGSALQRWWRAGAGLFAWRPRLPWRSSGPGRLEPALVELLRRTSRSFYLSLRFLPDCTRDTLALAYLLARAADTIADTALVPAEERGLLLEALRRRLSDTAEPGLDRLASRLRGADPGDAERRLLLHLPQLLDCLDRLPPGDGARSVMTLQTILDGMLLDRLWFPGTDTAGLRALASEAELEHYCHCVAGVVGEYWTDLHAAHLPGVRDRAAALRPLGARYGKGLQRLNILRDLPRDLRRGRCYLPAEELARLGLAPADLLEGRAATERARPLFEALSRRTLADLDAGWEYVRLLPRGELRLRLCSAWPLLLGVETLGRLWRAGAWLDADRLIKVRRPEVYRLLVESAARAPSRRALDGLWRRLRTGLPPSA